MLEWISQELLETCGIFVTYNTFVDIILTPFMLERDRSSSLGQTSLMKRVLFWIHITETIVLSEGIVGCTFDHVQSWIINTLMIITHHVRRYFIDCNIINFMSYFDINNTNLFKHNPIEFYIYIEFRHPIHVQPNLFRSNMQVLISI